VHIMDSQLKVTQVTVLSQRQEFAARSDWNSRQELVRIVLALLHYQLALDLLEFPQQDQSGYHVRWHDVQIAEEITQQPSDVGKRVL